MTPIKNHRTQKQAAKHQSSSGRSKSPDIAKIADVLKTQDDLQITAILEYMLSRTRWRGDNGDKNPNAPRTLKGAQIQRAVNKANRQKHGSGFVSGDQVEGFLLALQEGGIGEVVYAESGAQVWPELKWEYGQGDETIYPTMREIWIKFKGAQPPKAPGKEKRVSSKAYVDTVPTVDPRAVEQRMKEAAAAPTTFHSALAGQQAAGYPQTVAMPHATSDRGAIVVQIRGMEFELDLSKVPAELLKFRRML